jgi:diacylglycerol kinase family enzyme
VITKANTGAQDNDGVVVVAGGDGSRNAVVSAVLRRRWLSSSIWV